LKDHRTTCGKNLPRREFLKRSGAGAAATPAVFSIVGYHEKPNIVYLFSDTHRWGALPYAQTPAIQTPYMQQMLSQGVSMDRCYSTLPICTPYRAILMTGRWPWQQGLIANHMSLAQRVDMPGDSQYGTMGWTFVHAGYQTAYFGKWHIGGSDARPFGWQRSIIWAGTNDHDGPNTYKIDGGSKITWNGISNSTATTQQALDWLENDADQSKPFFLMISVNPPHGGMLDAREDMKALYPDETALPYHPNDELQSWNNHQGYHALTSGVDDDLGMVMQALEEKGLSKNTILVYTSDHGGMGGVRGIGYGSKRYPYDESSRVPFLIQWPRRIPPNRRLNTLFSTIDIYPTLCSLANTKTWLKRSTHSDAPQSLAYLESLPGVDHSKNLLNRFGGPDPDSVFVMHISVMNKNSSPFPLLHRTVVTKDYLYSVAKEGEYGLFAHAEGYQVTNLIEDPAHATAKAALRTRLGQWIDTAEAPFTDNWFANVSGSKMESWFGPQGNLNHPNPGDDGLFRLDEITGIVPEGTDNFTPTGS